MSKFVIKLEERSTGQPGLPPNLVYVPESGAAVVLCGEAMSKYFYMPEERCDHWLTFSTKPINKQSYHVNPVAKSRLLGFIRVITSKGAEIVGAYVDAYNLLDKFCEDNDIESCYVNLQHKPVDV
jgi:hypothetical protein